MLFRLKSSEEGEEQDNKKATTKMDKMVFIGFNFDSA
jgi:hypothetical protein